MKEELQKIIDGYNQEKLYLVKVITGADSSYTWSDKNIENAKERLLIIDVKVTDITNTLLK